MEDKLKFTALRQSAVQNVFKLPPCREWRKPASMRLHGTSAATLNYLHHDMLC